MAEDANIKNIKGSEKDAKTANKKEEKTHSINKKLDTTKKSATTETQKAADVQKEEEKKEKEIEVPEKFKDLVEKIEEMSVLDLAELVKVLEDKFGVSASVGTPVAIAGVAQQASGAPSGATEEKSEFNIELKEVGSQKIQVIKVIREITEKGLKEAKDIVDAAPKVIKENVKKEEAEEIKKKLEAVGAKVELK